MTRSPLLEDDDHFLALILNARVNPVTGLLFDLQPPYRQYPANFNWINGMGNPLAGLPG